MILIIHCIGLCLLYDLILWGQDANDHLLWYNWASSQLTRTKADASPQSTLCWSPVFRLWQGSSTDIICGFIIIQATASPQGSPAETRPLPHIYLFISLYLESSLAHGCHVCPSVTPMMDEFESNLRLDEWPRNFRGFRVHLLCDPTSRLQLGCTLVHSDGAK